MDARHRDLQPVGQVLGCEQLVGVGHGSGDLRPSSWGRSVAGSCSGFILFMFRLKTRFVLDLCLNNQVDCTLTRGARGDAESTPRTALIGSLPTTESAVPIPNLAALLDSAAEEISSTLQKAHRRHVEREFDPDSHQLGAIESTAPFIRILAPAGSGKTATIVEKALRIVESDPAARVLMLTFTNAGVDAFNSRVQLQASHFASRCSATTLNKFGLSAQRALNPRLKMFPHTKPHVAHPAVKQAMATDLGIPTFDSRLPFEHLWDATEITKQLGFAPESDPARDGATLKLLDRLRVIQVLYAHLDRAGLDMDLTLEAIHDQWLPLWRDILVRARPIGLTFEDQKFWAFWNQQHSPALERHIAQKKVTHLLVDEFQDINLLELYLITSIARLNAGDLHIVGDDDQCIYEWKGCTPYFITDPDQLIPGLVGSTNKFETHILETNYRCPPNIVRVSKSLIEHNFNRVQKDIVAVGGRDANIREIRLPTSAISMVTIARLLKAVTERDPEHRFALLARKKSQLVPLQVLLTRDDVDFYIPRDCNIFLQETFQALLDAFESRAVLNGQAPAPSSFRARELLLTMADRVWSRPLYKQDRKVVVDALKTADTLPEGLQILDDARALPRKKNQTAAISNAIRAFASRHTCAEALRDLFVHFKGFNQDYGKSKDDVFRRDPPLALLIDLATNYDDESSFVADLRASRVRAAAKSGASDRDSAAVSLLTAYRAKGRQFDTVVVLDANDRFWPSAMAVQDGRIEEERRLFYVAVTRAQANLLFFSSDHIQGRSQKVTQFIGEMGLDDSSRVRVKLPDEVITSLLSLYPLNV